MKTRDVTIILPVYDLGTLRFNNFCFLIKKLNNIGCAVIVVEQKSKSSGIVEQISINLENVTHLPVNIEHSKFNKSKLYNYAAKNSFTKFLWFVDGDFYTDFKTILEKLDTNVDFVVPFKEVLFLNHEETTELHCSGKIRLNHESDYKKNDQTGKFSFIVSANKFSKAGGFNEDFQGWGFQDLDFVENRLPSDVEVFRVNELAYHMYHAPASKEFANVNRQLYINFKEFNQKDIVKKKLKEYHGQAIEQDRRRKFYREAKLKKSLVEKTKKNAEKKQVKLLAKWKPPTFGILHSTNKQVFYPSLDVITIRETHASKLASVNGKKSKLSTEKHFIYFYLEYICHIYELLGTDDVLLFANDSFCKSNKSTKELKTLIETIKNGNYSGGVEEGFKFLHKEWTSDLGKYTPQCCFLISAELVIKKPYEYYHKLFTSTLNWNSDKYQEYRKEIKKLFLD